MVLFSNESRSAYITKSTKLFNLMFDNCTASLEPQIVPKMLFIAFGQKKRSKFECSNSLKSWHLFLHSPVLHLFSTLISNWKVEINTTKIVAIITSHFISQSIIIMIVFSFFSEHSSPLWSDCCCAKWVSTLALKSKKKQCFSVFNNDTIYSVKKIVADQFWHWT